jgi:hypothetical protein
VRAAKVGGGRLFQCASFLCMYFLSLSSTTRAVFADKIVLTRVLPDCALRGGKVRDEDHSQHTKGMGNINCGRKPMGKMEIRLT